MPCSAGGANIYTVVTVDQNSLHTGASDDQHNGFYPFGLFKLFVELFKRLIVFLPHVGHLLFVDFSLFLQRLLQMRDLSLTL